MKITWRTTRKIPKIRLIRVEIDIEFVRPVTGRLLIPFFWLWCIRVVRAELYGKKIYMVCIPKFYYVK